MTTAANENTPRRGGPLTLTGLVTDLEDKVAGNGSPYFTMNFAYDMKGRSYKKRALAFDEAYLRIKRDVANGRYRLCLRLGLRSIAILSGGVALCEKEAATRAASRLTRQAA